MAKQSKAIIFVLLITIGMFFTIFAFVAQQTSGSSSQPDPNASCALSQYATGETTGSFLCKQPGYQELTNTPAITNEVAGGCSQLNLYATTESTNGNINCARVNQGFNQTGLNLYAQLDEGSGSTIYDLSINHVIGLSFNSPSWLSVSNCMFQQFCQNFTSSSSQYITLGHSYNDSGNAPITICDWFFGKGTTTQDIFGDDSKTGIGNGYGFRINNGGGTLVARRSSTGAGGNINTPTTPLVLNQWHFGCLTYTFFSSSNAWLSLYLDGFLKSSVNASQVINADSRNYTIGNTPQGVNQANGFYTGRNSVYYQFNYALSNSSILALYEYVPNPTEQNPVLWQQLTGFPANCGANQFVFGVTTTLSCSSAWFSYGSCPANQFATAITTTTLNCGAVSTEGIASCATGQFATSENAAGSFSCGAPSIAFTNNSNTCTDTTSGTALQMGFKLSYTAVGTGQVTVAIAWQISTPATTTIHTQYKVSFGTGTAPNCNAAVTGTSVGNLFELGTWSAVASFVQPEVTVGILTLTPGTTYWFDVRATDSTGASWIYSNPQMTVLES